MAKAYYPSGGSFKEWTPDMVGAFPSQTISMPSTSETKYYLLATVTAQQWGNYRCSFIVNSRHSGCGIVTVAFGNNTNSLTRANMYAQIFYYGTTNQVSDSQIFQVYGSADGEKCGAKEYAELALSLKDDSPQLSSMYNDLSKQEYSHIQILHSHLLKAYTTLGEQTDIVQNLFDWQNKKIIDGAAHVKTLIDMYK